MAANITGLLQDAIGWLRDELSDLSDMELERAFYEGMKPGRRPPARPRRLGNA